MARDIQGTAHAATLPLSSGSGRLNGDGPQASAKAEDPIPAEKPLNDPKEAEQVSIDQPVKRRLFTRFATTVKDGDPAKQEPADDGKDKQRFTAVGQLKATLLNSWVNLLLFAAPVGSKS